jgi:phospholipid/cholesterol/gamma-HCH transport system substrate-binding protein
VSKSASNLDEFLAIWKDTGRNVSGTARRLDGFVAANEGEFKPALASLREVADKLNGTLDPKTQDALKTGINRFAMASARLDSGLSDAAPFLKDLGLPSQATPQTDFGVTLRRLNRITADVGLLTAVLNNGRGKLNPDGSLQKLLTRPDLHDNLNRMATTATETFAGFRTVISSFRIFAEKIARDPASISRGAFQQ